MKIEEYKLKTRQRQVTYTLREVEINGRWYSVDKLFDIIEDLKAKTYIAINDMDLVADLKTLRVVKYAVEGDYCVDSGFESFCYTLYKAANQ